MITDESKTLPAVYQLKITLADSAPEVWRRVIIPSSATLAELHHVIQQSMGWEDLHAYQFRLGLGKDKMLSSVDQPAAQFLTSEAAVNQTLYYNYDAKSGWLHRIELEVSETDEAKNLSAPVCVDGQSACPPEGSGGVWGYDDLLAKLEDPEDPDYLDLIDKYGDFDPDTFKISEANARLSKLS
ncbi:MAG: plasmid pRiA4b ORF-3 family protein [Cyanobacteria bacterium P01_D01_bin.1]